MNKLSQKIALGFAILAIGMSSVVAHAATQANHAVTVVTPATLSITADETAFTLTFPDYVSGTVSDTQLVTYTVTSNQMTSSGGIAGKLSELYTDVDLKATAGTWNGTGGGRTWTSEGEQTLAVTDKDLALADTGNGVFSRGEQPVTFQAVATADLAPGNQLKTVTITVANS